MSNTELKSPETIKFSEIKVGTRFSVDGIIHRKVSATATYGYSARDIKEKRGIYSFKPETELLIINNN